MLEKTGFAKLKAKEARARGVLFKEKSIREEWFTMARNWDELAREYVALESKRTSMDAGTDAGLDAAETIVPA